MIFICLILLCSVQYVWGQNIRLRTVDSVQLQQFVQSLVGEGVVIKKFHFNLPPSSEAYGYFEDKSNHLGIQKGILLTSGSVFNFGKNYPYKKQPKWGRSKGDKILANFLDKKPPTFDACVLDLEIVPLADTLCFNFIFGSEEYETFVGTPFNDTFGFLLFDTKDKKMENLAVVPYTTIPIAINNVNNGSSSVTNYIPQNPSFYVKNTSKKLVYGGFTRLIQVRKYVKRQQPYRLRVAITDVNDGLLDSGVIIEGKSIMSYFENMHIEFEHNSSTVDKKFYKDLDTTIQRIRELKYSEYKILVAGHTDADGNDAYNYELSKQRVDETVTYFVKQGFKREQFLVEYRGETMPIATNETPTGKQRNRRVEIRVLGATNTTNHKIIP